MAEKQPENTTESSGTTTAENQSGSTPESSKTRNLSVIVTIIILALAAIYAFTGKDYLGLFTAEETVVLEPIATPLPEIPEDTWWTVYFTDPENVNDSEDLSGSIPEHLIELIDAAESTIHIASFEFNLDPVAEALIAAHERGVEVQWVTDDEFGIDADEDDGHGQFEMLEDAGIEIVDDGRAALMHNKFWIFDGQIVWTGSTNITKNGNFRNNNNVVVVRSEAVAEMYEREFAEMFHDGQFGPRSPSTVELQSTLIDGVPVDVLFAAEDDAIINILPLIADAKKSIRIMAFAFTHEALGEAMLVKAEDGVDVVAIFETRGSETEYSELPKFYCAGIPARQDGNKGTFHHKVILIDNEILITGSLNFSDNAEESNDENVIIIQDREIAQLYLQEFGRRWAEAREPEPADMNCK